MYSLCIFILRGGNFKSMGEAGRMTQVLVQAVKYRVPGAGRSTVARPCCCNTGDYPNNTNTAEHYDIMARLLLGASQSSWSKLL